MSEPTRGPWLARVFALTILLGAFLLFQVQPLLSKWILPWFGGGPEVWTTCLVFFQSVLFAGYAYAHVSDRCLPAPWRPVVHVGLILAACWLLPIRPDGVGARAGEGDPTGRILMLLTAGVGAPYFLLSSTGPLVQAWFSRAYPGRSPYRLYALSNAGSLAALLTYPLLFEPLCGLRTQSTVWMATFLAFAVLYAVGAFAAGRVRPAVPAPSSPEAAPESPPPTTRQAALWILLPAFASWMLLASTNQMCQDMAVIPFLWVLPLAVYLLSFIISFDRPRWYTPNVYAPGTAALVFVSAAAYAFHSRFPLPFALGTPLALAALFFICMLCHGELARLKPAPRFLTGYYLAVSGGGALGGLFVSLVAPRIFATYLEWNLGMAVAYVAAWTLLAWVHRGKIRARLNLWAALLGIAALGLAFIGAFFGDAGTPLEVVRNFYGVVTVESPPGVRHRERDSRDLVHGRVVHGRQHLRESYRAEPTTYYVERTGIGRALQFFRSRDDLRVGVVGLGIGTVAAYGALPSQSFRFYEINPEVVRLAHTYFTYLRECRSRVDVVLGDARLSLEREPPQRFHVLALDAFSADTIPTHLLTTEAMEIYLRHVRPDGVIAVHVSNRHLDLAPVVRGVARRFGLTTVEIGLAPEQSESGHSSDWILCTRDDAAVRALSRYASGDRPTREVVWTDDRSALVPLLKPIR